MNFPNSPCLPNHSGDNLTWFNQTADLKDEFDRVLEKV